jgi:hypothetical protein
MLLSLAIGAVAIRSLGATVTTAAPVTATTLTIAIITAASVAATASSIAITATVTAGPRAIGLLFAIPFWRPRSRLLHKLL